jgi:hypothetical protein
MRLRCVASPRRGCQGCCAASPFLFGLSLLRLCAPPPGPSLPLAAAGQPTGGLRANSARTPHCGLLVAASAGELIAMRHQRTQSTNVASEGALACPGVGASYFDRAVIRATYKNATSLEAHMDICLQCL